MDELQQRGRLPAPQQVGATRRELDRAWQNQRYIIESVHGKEITAVLLCPNEREALLPAGMRFEVINVTEPIPGRFEIQLAGVR